MNRKIIKYCLLFLAGFLIVLVASVIIRTVTGFFINMYEIKNTGMIIIDLASIFMIILFYLIIYYIYFIATKESELLFSKRLADGYGVKACFNIYMKTTGKNEIIIFALYSSALMIFCHEFEMFYTDTRIIGCLFGVLLFSAGYAACRAATYNRWNKNWNKLK